MADYTVKAGDSGPASAFVYTLPDCDEDDAESLAGATVQFTARSLTATAPLALTGTSTITDPGARVVTYTPTLADTSSPAGVYMATWQVTFADGSQKTYPNTGWLSWSIEDSLGAMGQQLVSLPDIRDQINVSKDNHVSDEKLLRWLRSATVLIEALIGPVIVRTFDEWHEGGNTYIKLRRRPSTALGTNPIVTLLACSEYIGPIEWPLAVVQSPDYGQMYSCMLDSRRGIVTRRTAGGGLQPFAAGMADPQAVHVVYQAGQQFVPENVQEAAIECVRVWYWTTQAVGKGFRSRMDEEDTGPQVGIALPPGAMRLLKPMRKAPSIR